jgi:hypothetical protein
MDGPEAEYDAIARDLADALVGVIPGWLERIALARMVEGGVRPSEDHVERARAAAEVTAASLEPRLVSALTADVDEGGANPLAVLRSDLGAVTDLLFDVGATPPERDEFKARLFPDDPFELGPAAFEDLDESVRVLGIRWGAARAHVHLRRRRELDP